MSKIYTIGHSNHPITYFIELLDTYQIKCVVDIRSIPSSRYNPQFNQSALEKTLRQNHKIYLPFGKEFGAYRTHENEYGEDNQVDYAKVQQGENFLSGVKRLQFGLKQNYSIALMCAEAEPLNCHRFSMISRFLNNNQFDVWHILKDKTVISHAEAECQLVKKYASQLPKPNLFHPTISKKEQIKQAYTIHNQITTYRKK